LCFSKRQEFHYFIILVKFLSVLKNHKLTVVFDIVNKYNNLIILLVDYIFILIFLVAKIKIIINAVIAVIPRIIGR